MSAQVKQAKPCPSEKLIHDASATYRDWQLHYYQLLWFHEPKLTQPGRNGRPLSVEFDPDHIGCLKVVVPQNPAFNFSVLNFLNGKSQEEYDAEFLRKATAVVATLNSGKTKVDQRACCPLATIRGCVCAISFSCEIHGTQCVGSHD